MSLREEIYNKLIVGVPWKEVESSTRSRSTLYSALSDYLEGVGDKVEGVQALIKDTEGELSGKQRELKDVVAEISSKVSERGSLDDELGVLKRELEAAKNDYLWIKDAYEKVNAEYSDLKGRGVTDDIVAYFKQIDFTSHEDLLDRIKAAESVVGVWAEFGDLYGKCEDFKQEIERGEKEKLLLETQVAAERNRLDEARRQSWIYNEANKVVQGYLEREYSAELLLSILKALDNLAIEGVKDLSIMRLVEGLQGVKKLEELDSAIRSREKEIEILNINRDVVAGEFTAVKDFLLSEITDMKDKGISELGEYAGVQRTQLETYRVNTEKTLGLIGDGQRGHLNDLIGKLDERMKGYEAWVKHWGEQKQEFGALADDIAYGRMIRNVRGGNVKDLPKVVIYQLCSAVQGWIFFNIPDLRIKPLEETADMEYYLSQYNEYRLLAFADLLTKYFSITAEGANYEDYSKKIWG